MAFCYLMLRKRLWRQWPGRPSHVRVLAGLRQTRGPRRLELIGTTGRRNVRFWGSPDIADYRHDSSTTPNDPEPK